MHIQIDAHVGSVNDIAFALPDMQPCIVTCGDDMKIKVWDFVDGRMQYVLKGHEAPVYSLCPHHEEQMPASLLYFLYPFDFLNILNITYPKHYVKYDIFTYDHPCY